MKSLWGAILTVSLFVIGCSGSGDGPPLQGTVRAENPRASQIFTKAQREQAAGNNGRATRLYERLVDRYPADKTAEQARFAIGQLLTAEGDYKGAFNAFQDFIRRHPGSPLYEQAFKKQEEVAHAAATGQIRESFLGVRSRVDRDTIVEMLTKVRDNAPRAESAPRAQFLIGRVNEIRDRSDDAVVAFQKLIDEFPRSPEAPEAQFRIGEVLLKIGREGNQDQANLARAKEAFQDLLIAYPNSSFSEQARQRIASIGSRDLQATYSVAEFYRKKGKRDSAAFYYQEVVEGSAPGDLKNRAAARLAEMTEGQ